MGCLKQLCHLIEALSGCCFETLFKTDFQAYGYSKVYFLLKSILVIAITVILMTKILEKVF